MNVIKFHVRDPKQFACWLKKRVKIDLSALQKIKFDKELNGK